ncbi:MAG: hypothetical protein ACLRTQ_02025 [Candidatus Borkfalkia sp.]
MPRASKGKAQHKNLTERTRKKRRRIYETAGTQNLLTALKTRAISSTRSWINGADIENAKKNGDDGF